MIEVLGGGGMTTVQDLGRPGLAHLGVPPSGAADPGALRLANRLLGNPDGAAALELTLASPRLRFAADAAIALAGAPLRASAGKRPVPMNGPHYLRRGEVLRCEAPRAGLRTYLAVRGGIAVQPVLGSRATDLLTGLGPAPLRPGDRLPVGTPSAPMPGVDLAPVLPPEREPTLRVVPGPRADWFAPAALRQLAAAPYEVGVASNRIGLRLRGTPLDLVRADQLLSEGVVTGALQVPPSGQPILLLNDHPTTGGYPVIAVVHSADLGRAGQLRPGQPVRFAPIGWPR